MCAYLQSPLQSQGASRSLKARSLPELSPGFKPLLDGEEAVWTTGHQLPPKTLNIPTNQQKHLKWVSDPTKAKLRRLMGIGADLDSKTQSDKSRDLRREVRMLADIGFNMTWTELTYEGKTD